MSKKSTQILVDDLEDRLTTKKDEAFVRQVLDYLAEERGSWEAQVRQGVDPKQYKQVKALVAGIKSAEKFVKKL